MIVLKYPKLLFLFNRDGENVSKCPVLSNWLRKSLGKSKNNATLKMVQPKVSPGLGEIDGKMISTWNFGMIIMIILSYHTQLSLEGFEEKPGFGYRFGQV
jgi:hypothetical protein